MQPSVNNVMQIIIEEMMTWKIAGRTEEDARRELEKIALRLINYFAIYYSPMITLRTGEGTGPLPGLPGGQPLNGGSRR